MTARVRAARQSDKAPLMDFIKQVWGGHDYIPRVWDQWIRERGANMFVVEVAGRPVGMNRVRFLEDGNAWFEGARIHPAHRGRGLASKLGRNSLRIAAERGVKICRLVSGSRNKAAHRQIARIGFKEVARMSLYSPRKNHRFRPQAGVRKAKPEDAPWLTSLIESSKEFKVGSGVYWDTFTAISLTPETIDRRVKEGLVYLSEDAVAVAKQGGEGRGTWRQICFATGDTKGVARIIKHVFGKKERRKATWRIVYAPQRSPLIATAKAAGLERWGSSILFERRAPKG